MAAKQLTPEQIEAAKRYEEKSARLAAIIQPIRKAAYTVDCEFSYMEKMLAGYHEEFGLDLTPDFQRGHEWAPDQQQHFIENIFRGVVSEQGLCIQLNTPDWEGRAPNCDLPRTMLCMDGLQRLTAVRDFMAGKVKPFGYSCHDLEGCSFSPNRSFYRLRLAIYSFQTRAEVLRHYLAINAGGTPHSKAEIERVRGLLAMAESGRAA